AAQDEGAAAGGFGGGVMPGGDEVGPYGLGALPKGVPFHEAVAIDAGVRGLSGQVGFVERRNDALLEILLHVQGEMRNADLIAYALGVHGAVGGAAGLFGAFDFAIIALGDGRAPELHG